MRIGIVLAAVPGYSETFFRNKIKVLQETNDFEVIVFADYRLAGIEWSLCKIIYAPQGIEKKGIGNILKLIYFTRAFLFHPMKAFRLWKKNDQSGFAFQENVQSIIRSSHLFNQNLDWLHFGFGTMAIARENLADVINAKMAVSFRGFDHYIYPLKNPGCYRRTFLAADKFHVLSEAMKNQLLDEGIQESKIKVITPAINISQFKPDEIQKNSSDPIKIVTVARIHWIKGLEYTLEALALLRTKGIHFLYTIIGSGTELERLTFIAHQLGLKDYVTFVGKKNSNEVSEYLRASDVYIQYSVQEGFCNAVLEAQAMGLLCIVSDADGLKENVQHGVTGWVTPKRNPAALAEQLHEVILLPLEDRTAVRSRAIHRVANHFSIPQQRDKFVEFYHNR